MKYLGIFLVIVLLGANPSWHEIVLDAVSQGEKIIAARGDIAVLYQGVMKMSVESLLKVRDILDIDNAAHRNLLPLLLIAVRYWHDDSIHLLDRLSYLLTLYRTMIMVTHLTDTRQLAEGEWCALSTATSEGSGHRHLVPRWHMRIVHHQTVTYVWRQNFELFYFLALEMLRSVPFLLVINKEKKRRIRIKAFIPSSGPQPWTKRVL